MKLLAIETSTEACSAALTIDDEINVRYELAPRRHTELILPMIDGLMREADLRPTQLDGLALGRGPGAFTGVRIASGIVQGIAFAADLPVASISSLAALAQGCHRQYEARQVMAAIDARMNEVYWCCFEFHQGILQPCMDEGVYSAKSVPLPNSDRKWYGAGTGWESYSGDLKTRVSNRIIDVYPDLYPSAEDLIPLALQDFEAGDVVAADQVAPVYLRDQVVS